MARKTLFKPCKGCGTPRIAGCVFEWKSDGTVITRLAGGTRLVLADTEIYHTVMTKAEERIGVSVGDIAFDTTRNVTRTALKDFPTRVPGLQSILRLGFSKRSLINIFHSYSRLCGHSASETVEYKPGKHAIARIKNPIDIDIVTGTISGTLEALDRVPYKHQIEEEEENQYLVRVESMAQQEPIPEMPEVEFPPVLPGNILYEKCSHCGLPKTLSTRFKWNHEEGALIEVLSGRRFCTVSYTIIILLKELARQYGEDVYDSLIETQRDLTIAHVRLRGDAEKPDSFEELVTMCRSYIDDCSLFGLGNPVLFDIKGDSMELVVENPFDVYLLAGTLLGLYDVFIKKKSAINWYLPKEGVVSFVIEPG